jgi:hypothetical protein
MEPDEVHELHEHHEQAEKDHSLRPVTFTMSLLAVLVAVCTVLGHRTHSEAILAQARASDQWNEYQAKKIRQNETQLTSDLLSTLATHDPNAEKLIENYKQHMSKWAGDLSDEQNKAHELETEVRRAERRGGRFDLGEVLLEVALVITSITLLTRQRPFWFAGMVLGAIGVIISASAFLLPG